MHLYEYSSHTDNYFSFSDLEGESGSSQPQEPETTSCNASLTSFLVWPVNPFSESNPCANPLCGQSYINKHGLLKHRMKWYVLQRRIQFTISGNINHTWHFFLEGSAVDAKRAMRLSQQNISLLS